MTAHLVVYGFGIAIVIGLVVMDARKKRKEEEARADSISRSAKRLSEEQAKGARR